MSSFLLFFILIFVGIMVGKLSYDGWSFNDAVARKLDRKIQIDSQGYIYSIPVKPRWRMTEGQIKTFGLFPAVYLIVIFLLGTLALFGLLQISDFFKGVLVALPVIWLAARQYLIKSKRVDAWRI